MEPVSLAYLAGFFDGEGSIYPRNGLQVSAVQVDPRPLDLLAARFGGRVREHPTPAGHRQMHRWVVYGGAGAGVLRALLPWLVVKREQAEWALEYSLLVNPRGCNQVPAEVKIERERLRQLIMGARTGAATRREDRAWA